ncbi:DUF7577 domain-containing protein [Natronolimnohabitans innermongolicus]|uniref:DUF7577 domain-containing protein n=1 Tax=Natronolimnohabitans innermongolicus JCM 12255 TaxID=1227499 RepID=L9WVF8_9EURY|nr:hypothetical protein [Natronolimnohabitans innermongolicus]ELY53402.1 hypothetical protein C493_14068 [Natronolimnohabitans innermongolicus JCM 12255]
MELWGWLIGYVVLFALLHLVLYYVYVRGEDGENAGSPSLADPNRASSRTTPGADRYPRAADDVDPEEIENDHDHDLESAEETMRCPHCGVRNEADQTFTYCWNCVSSLRR